MGRDLKNISLTTASSQQQYDNQEMQTVQDNIEAKSFKLAEERAFEAASIYSKGVMYCGMEVECLLRLARIHETMEWKADREHKAIFSSILD